MPLIQSDFLLVSLLLGYWTPATEIQLSGWAVGVLCSVNLAFCGLLIVGLGSGSSSGAFSTREATVTQPAGPENSAADSASQIGAESEGKSASGASDGEPGSDEAGELAMSAAPMDSFELTDEAAKRLMEEEEERNKQRKKKGRIRELEEVSPEFGRLG